jgi:hypothetical protein
VRPLVTCALLAVALFGCSVVAPEYREPAARTAGPTPSPAPLQPVTFKVNPLEIRPGDAATTKTAVFFSNPNSFLMDWSMAVRLKDKDGTVLRDERIGSTDAPADRSDPKFQNWYFPIPPGESWTVLRFDTAIAESDVQEFKATRAAAGLTEVTSVQVTAHACHDASGAGIACEFTVASTATIPAFTRLHLVVVVQSRDETRAVLRALQWRPELGTARDPWLKIAVGEKLELQFQDNYPTPTVPWLYQVFWHAYQFSSQ